MNSGSPKSFKTLDEQCDIIFDKRHLKVPSNKCKKKSIGRLKNELIQKNYFDLVNGLEDVINVSDPKHKYYGDYSLDDLLGLYKLNEDLRQLLLANIGRFEISLKTSIAYHFSRHYPIWNDYRDPSHYKDITRNDLEEVFYARFGYSINYSGDNPRINQRALFPFFVTDNVLRRKLRRKERYMSAYGGCPPLWVAIKILDFGQTHLMFTLLNATVAKEVLADFNLKPVERPEFESVLYVVNWLRNECAHFEMINKSRYHAKYPVDASLIKRLGLRTNRSRRNLNLFQVMCILDSIQEIKISFFNLIKQSRIPSRLKSSYLRSIGYWRQSNWPLPFDF
ncbi:hypothetical protein BTW26_07570 [Pediococcus acidilactici]|uniref:Abi family protein n=1 Tax=Pediococcus acidilactici TaxID=1254 RepID=UPI000947344B|nr:Abi family protein [Pediococcus acidilactici]APR28872.1 hypothetical protein BTW26_07570 [Pediococcus acidilactici]